MNKNTSISLGEHFTRFVDQQVEAAGRNVHPDAVAVLDEGDRTAVHCFRRRSARVGIVTRT